MGWRLGACPDPPRTQAPRVRDGSSRSTDQTSIRQIPLGSPPLVVVSLHGQHLGPQRPIAPPALVLQVVSLGPLLPAHRSILACADVSCFSSTYAIAFPG